MKHLLIVAAILLAASSVFAQTLSITATSQTPTTAGATIAGSITGTNQFGGVTNLVSVRVFWGGSNQGETSTAWAVSAAATCVGTNGSAFSYAITGVTPNRVVYWNARAQDSTGDAWLSAVGSFTTASSAGATPDLSWRETLRTGTVTSVSAVTGSFTRATATTGTITTGVIGTLTVTTNTFTIWKIGASNYTLGVATNVDATGLITNLVPKLQQLAP